METALFQRPPGNGRQELQQRGGVLLSEEFRQPVVQRPPPGIVQQGKHIGPAPEGSRDGLPPRHGRQQLPKRGSGRTEKLAERVKSPFACISQVVHAAHDATPPRAQVGTRSPGRNRSCKTGGLLQTGDALRRGSIPSFTEVAQQNDCTLTRLLRKALVGSDVEDLDEGPTMLVGVRPCRKSLRDRCRRLPRRVRSSSTPCPPDRSTSVSGDANATNR